MKNPKKYKLIKEYPGSPKLDSIIEIKNNGGYELENSTSYFMTKDKVENYPEFWEKVVEKDYEILSVIIPNYNQICKKEGDYFAAKRGGISPFILGTHIDYKIHSVKRLSDGEVFTIGDKVIISKLQHDGSFTIDEFYFDCNNDKLLCNGKCTGNGHVSIIKIEHYKKPLFTTEDDVDIYEGDKYFQLVVSFSPNFREAVYEEIGRSNIKYGYNCKEGKEQLNKNGRYYFSTKEAAEEYILMNKPCLSINDIERITGILPNSQRDAMKKLIKLI